MWSSTTPNSSCILPCLFLLLGACGGSSGGGATTGPDSSLKGPRPGSIVGNWEVVEVKPNPAVLKPVHPKLRIFAGMNFRISKSGVEVLADEYVGPGTVLPDIMKKFYGGEFDFKQFRFPANNGYDVDLILDYSPLFSQAPRKLYTHVSARITLVDDKLVVDLLIEEFWPDSSGGAGRVAWNDLKLVCLGGVDIPALAGTWSVQDFLVLEDTSPSAAFPMPVPIGRRPRKGDKLEVSALALVSLFGSPFDPDEFRNKFPEVELVSHLGFVGNGVVQGFLAAVAKPGTPFAGLAVVGDFNFFHTGRLLQGDLRLIWPKPAHKSIAYHAYFVLRGGSVVRSEAEDPRPYSSPFLRTPAELLEFR